MASELQTSYATLERNVEERTHELSDALNQLRALGEVGQAVSSTLDLKQVLEMIVAHAVDLSAAETGAIFEMDEATGVFRLQATYRMSDDLAQAMEGARIDSENTAFGMAARQDRRRKGDAKRLCRLEVHGQIKFGHL